MYIFISHSSADASVAEEICSFIENNGATCFIAPRDIRAGEEYAEELIKGLTEADAMVLLMSENANKSPHVLREVERAVSRSIPILVYKLEEVELTRSMEYFLMTHQWINPKEKGDYSEILAFIDKYTHRSDETLNPFSKKTNQPAKKKKTIKFIVLPLVSILLLAGIVFAIFAFRNSNRLEVGDTVTLGTYNGEPINWRVLKINEDQKEAVLISSNIITMKAYDVAEGGTYNTDGTIDYWSDNSKANTDLELQIRVRGNNAWASSNIRTWLNSSAEVVEYADQAPVPTAMSEHNNGYHNEPGFLYAFTEDELEAIVETEIITIGNALSETNTVTTADKVFLLSSSELQWFEDANMSLYAVPTVAAVEQDDSNWYDIDVSLYQIDEYYWWLREPVEETTSKCYMVSNGYTQEKLTSANVGTEGFGIRPAITVDLNSSAFSE